MFSKVKKFASLYAAFFRASLTADLEFRANFLLRIVTDIFWYVAQVVSFEVLFNYTDQIGGWNRYEMRVFLGVLFLVDALYMVVFSFNLDQLSESVRKGSLDLLLTKPVNSQFMISCQRVSTAYLGNTLLAAVWLVWSITQLEGYSAFRLLWLLVMIPTGALTFYAIRFFFSAMAVIFQRAENLQYLWYNLYRLGTRPDSIYVPWFRVFLLTALPISMIGSVPARLVLGLASPWLAVWGVLVAVVAVWVSNLFWRFTLTKYASASS
ncbi:MAG: hypothetical protein EOP11_02060 [Proteobacteria bacterium]|nr:MAG: hypothetical protein EOP11_02060 [Pseudomonadota bacterium]